MKYIKQIQCNKCRSQLEIVAPACLGLLKCSQCGEVYENKKPYRIFKPLCRTAIYRDDMPGAIIQYVPKESKK